MARVVFFTVIITVLLVIGCASQSQKTTQQLRDYIQTSDYQKALDYVRSNKFFPEERSRLLKLMEEATLLHITGKYYQSLLVFDRAQDLSDQLFTTSVSKKVVSAVASDSLDNYYGERYERSLIRFYQALNHYLISQVARYEAYDKVPEKILTTSEQQFHVSAARAKILEWDSLLENYRSTRGGESVYKDDLAAKMLGAFIHEQIGTRSDIRIAIDLYNHAKTIIFRNYNTYPSLNEKYESFRKDFSKFPQMSESDVSSQYVSKTTHQKKLETYIDEKIKELSSGNQRTGNVHVVLQSGLISPKVAKVFDFPLPLAAASALSGNMAFAFTTTLLNTAAGSPPSITFELPLVNIQKTDFDINMIVKSADGKIVKSTPLILIDPLSDIAYESMDEMKTATYSKIGARVALKHVSAIASAFVAYKLAVNAGTPKFIAQMAAAGTYRIANSSIAESEKADLRYWLTLPNDIRMGSLDLNPGEYKITLERVDSAGNKHLLDGGKITVKSKKNTQLVNLRIN